MPEAQMDPNHDTANHSWPVEFSELGAATEAQKQIASSLGHAAVFDVLKLWLKVITPDAKIVEPAGCPLKILFMRRSDRRKFVRSFVRRRLAG
jgi:hypothetical protein